MATSSGASAVDQHVGLPLPLQDRIDGIARRSRGSGHQSPILPQQPVEERRFADVGSADDGQTRSNSLLLGLRNRQELTDLLSQLADSLVVLCGEQHLGLDTEIEELVERLLGGPRVPLVDHQNSGLAIAPKLLPDSVISCHQTILAIDDKEHEIALLYRDQDLLIEAERIVSGNEATGIDELDVSIELELCDIDHPIASHPWTIMNDRLPSAQQPVEERGLPHIGSADDGHRRSHPHRSTLESCGRGRATARRLA